MHEEDPFNLETLPEGHKSALKEVIVEKKMKEAYFRLISCISA